MASCIILKYKMDMEKQVMRLYNGVELPIMGIGTAPFGGYSHEALVHALKQCNIKHIDTARKYGTEHLVAKSIRDSNVVREELFITSKVWPSDYGRDRTLAAFNESLRQVDVKYFDLYLLHWPNAPEGCNAKLLIQESWKVLEELYSQGLCKAIGVSNFNISDLEDLKESWTILPHVNQLEVHVFNYPEKLLKYCRDIGIQIVGYSSMAKGKALSHPKVLDIAAKYQRPCSQIANRWVIQHGIAVIPKSTKCDRVAENCQVFDFKLSDSDMRDLDLINKTEYQSVVKIKPSDFNKM